MRGSLAVFRKSVLCSHRQLAPLFSVSTNSSHFQFRFCDTTMMIRHNNANWKVFWVCFILLVVIHKSYPSSSSSDEATSQKDDKTCTANSDSSNSCEDPSLSALEDDDEDDCARLRRGPMIWGPGDLNRMFQRLVTDSYYLEVYGPMTILSSPSSAFAKDTVGDSTALTDEDGDPWVVQLDNFLSAEECNSLIGFGHRIGYESSSTIRGGSREDPIRTSSTAWCSGPCRHQGLTQQILHRISNLTGIPATHMEPLQILRYRPHQFYQQHHDFVEHHLDLIPMGRLVTVMLYLNTVDAGGETSFPKLDLKIQPKQGRAVIWPNVKNDNPTWDADPRLDHAALPVLEGSPDKYAVNAWLHQRDCDTPYEKGCLNY